MKNTLYFFVILMTISGRAYSKTLKWTIGKDDQYKVRVELPRNFDYKKKKKYPVVINLHGYRSGIFIQRFLTRLGFIKNSKDFIHVLPEGKKNALGLRFWNSGPFCCGDEHTKRDDIKFFNDLLDKLIKDLGKVDESRIGVYGHSNGGFMAYRLACELNTRISAIATLASSMDARDENSVLTPNHPCPDKRAIPILHIHGDKDQSILLNGLDNGKTAYKSVSTVIWQWAEHNKCTKVTHDNRKFNGAYFYACKETTLTHFQGCKDNADVYFYLMHGVGHSPLISRQFNKKIIDFLIKQR